MLSKVCGKLRNTTRTIGHMSTNQPAKSVWIFLLVFLVAAWVALVWLAITVTETVVAMLEYVVELAQLY